MSNGALLGPRSMRSPRRQRYADFLSITNANCRLLSEWQFEDKFLLLRAPPRHALVASARHF